VAVAYNPSVSMSGLTLYLDGGNLKSYPGTGTTWSDLSGNGASATLVNSISWTSPYFTNFTGVSGNCITVNVTANLASLLSVGTGDFTYGHWVYFTTLSAGNQTLFYCGSGNSNLIRVASATSIDIIAGTSGSTQQITATIPTLTVNTWANIVVVRQSGTLTVYVNGVPNTPTASFTPSVSIAAADPGFLGNPNFAGQYLQGNFSVFQAYNTALSGDSVLQNFNALRGRFVI
jgi:Concanavalin A-like lectin/glucanases superfamily